ncbi:LOW QUALITY PROTEIN: transmembrane protein 140 [Elgaria multicarinata webbii]|uniref:LOW QUALITY PROTEIN: transmembrane protein 140 n=1 Tax=Elgaria multicarinata webbii TaxID=159646 RepID=UPI002FCCF747
MQLKSQRVIAKPSTGFWWQKYSPCLWYLSNLFLAIGYIALLFYALVWEAGNIVNLPMKTIGFYNFCLWDQEAEKLNCLMPEELKKMGVNMVALVLSRICIYITPVLCLFAASTVLQAFCLKDRDQWKLACVLLAICVLILPVGLVLFTFHIRRWILVSEIGKVFAMLVGAHGLLLLHVVIIVLYLARQFKDTHPRGQFFPQRSFP